MKKVLILLAMLVLFTSCATTEPRTEYIHVGPNWAAFNDLPQGKDIKVEVTADKKTYSVDEKMSFEVTSDTSGRVWVITVGPDDEPSVIFPNKLDVNNQIEANMPFRIPSTGSAWNMRAVEPTGKNLIVVLVTGPGVTLEELARIASGEGTANTKAIAIEQESPKWGSAKTVLSVVE